MPSLKEVKTRIGSVKSTRKITNAMKMVASSKLHHAQRAIECMRPYEKRLASIMTRFLSTMEGEVESVYSETREIRKVALVVISSNSSLCGAFNANIIKEFLKTAEEYKQKGVVVEVFPIGKKIAQAVQKAGYKFQSDNSDVLEHPEYIKAYNIAENFMQRFVNGEIDKVCIISQHFVNTSKQEICNNTFLPISLDDSANSKATAKSSNKGRQLDYIVEPSPASIISVSYTHLTLPMICSV